MKKTPLPQDWKSELQEFLGTEATQPPKGVSESILSRVHHDLNPSFGAVFLRLSAIHALVGAITLLFCPQFGFSLTSSMGLMGVFTRWGEEACMAGCGAIFMGVSLLAASLVLRPEEVRAIRRTELLQVTVLALLSIGLFICTGAAAIAGLSLFWVLGAILAGLGTFELGWALRRRVLAR